MAQNNEPTVEKKVRGKPFQKGQSGNPGGRPKAPTEFTELAKNNSITALKTAIEIMNNSNAKPLERLKAVEIIMDRAYGKASQIIDADIQGGLNIVLEGEVKEWAK